MKKIYLPLFLSLVILALGASIFILSNRSTEQSAPPTETTPSKSPAPTTSSPGADLTTPIAQFKERITKKSFGTYVNPSNSPVHPERFYGYHTGVDVEYTDTTADVPVYAIADGTVVTSEYASGYGGVIVIRQQINDQTFYVIYGHLRPSTLPKLNQTVRIGEQIGVLGTGYSPETDGERRHLHFGTAKTNTILGYVPNLAELHTTWLDPRSFYPQEKVYTPLRSSTKCIYTKNSPIRHDVELGESEN